MARVEVWESVIDTSGAPVSGVSVHIYDARTTNHTTVYSAETGPTTLAQPVTTSNGNIPGWVDEGEYDLYIPSVPVTVRFNAIVGGNPTLGALTIDTGDIADDAINAAKIAAGAVGSSEIAADAVGSSEIATDAVGSAEIAAGAVGTAELDDNSVTLAKMTDDSVDTDELVDEAVTQAKISPNAVTTVGLDANAVQNENLTDDSVGVNEIMALPICVLAKTQDIGNNSETTITFDTESADPTNMHSTSSNTSRITIATPGLYRILASAYSSDADLAANELTRIMLYLNGVRTEVATTQVDALGLDTSVFVHTVYPLSATQYLETKIYQLTGETITYTVRFSAQWMGPTT